jgi:hypothetical protein
MPKLPHLQLINAEQLQDIINSFPDTASDSFIPIDNGKDRARDVRALSSMSALHPCFVGM